jgi:dipeptidyl aminopeptidase/acylaminoacyl peptidase
MMSRQRLARFLTVIALAPMSGAPIDAQSSPTIDDLLNLKRVGAPAISPDGRRAAYTVRETNWDDNAYETEIWIGDGSETRQITFGKKSSQQPAWSPDGRWLAFVSDREGKRQVYRIAIAGGDAERLTSGDEDVNALAWSTACRSARSVSARCASRMKTGA